MDLADLGRLPSKKRIAGASLFGLLSAMYILNAAEETIPRILGMAQKVDLRSAQNLYDSSDVLRSVVFFVTAFMGAATAGFLSRRRGVLAGILSNSIYLAIFGYLFVHPAALEPTPRPAFGLASHLPLPGSVQGQMALRLILLVLVAAAGGLIGQSFYSSEVDLDVGQDKLTVFGVRWAHYFWIIPLIYLVYLESAIIIAYAVVVVFLSDFSFAWHPSLWISPTWWIWWLVFPVAPGLVYLAIWISAVGFVRFFAIMQRQQTKTQGWKKVGLVLLYGIGAPSLSYTVAALGADAAHAMPKPAEGDWKIALAVVVVIVTLSLLSKAWRWLTRTFR
ncbi:MAG: hypothetical protein ABSD45_14275 [Terriglobia bacterium]|jgi:hypothetical protein